MQRSSLPYFFLGLAAVLAISALVIFIMRPGVTPAPPNEPPAAITKPGEVTPPPKKTDPAQPPAVPGNPPVPPKNPPLIPADQAGQGVASDDPADLVQQIAKALEANDLTTLEILLGKNALDQQTLARLKALGATGLRLRQQGGIHEIGELELNTRTRWALELESQQPGRDRIFLDLRRVGQKWTVDKLTLPPAAGEPVSKTALTDAMGVADALIQALLKQNFELAREFVDSTAVSDAKIAGLCILFEEGGYQLRKSKPLRAMFQRPDTTGYLAYVETQDAGQSAQFSLTLKQAPAPMNWRVSEINLDALLADYARRVAGGDIYYSPLVKNPTGGDTIALYFEFDEDSVNPRTARQLQIVSRILRADAGKKLTLSGHTDALGTDNYNHDLSSRRADVVRDFLIKEGVAAAQIVTIAKGSSQPRRPNVTETGKDDPTGRRANRRTEIYLDF